MDEDKVVFRSDENHLNYWNDYPLPVIIVLHDPTTDIVYWEVVNEHTFISTGKGWKLDIPLHQKLDKDNYASIKRFGEYSLSANSFTVMSFDDLSHNAAKRYSSRVILNHKMSRGEIVQVVKSITDSHKKREYYRNRLTEERWKMQPANVVCLSLCRR